MCPEPFFGERSNSIFGKENASPQIFYVSSILWLTTISWNGRRIKSRLEKNMIFLYLVKKYLINFSVNRFFDCPHKPLKMIKSGLLETVRSIS